MVVKNISITVLTVASAWVIIILGFNILFAIDIEMGLRHRYITVVEYTVTLDNGIAYVTDDEPNPFLFKQGCWFYLPDGTEVNIYENYNVKEHEVSRTFVPLNKFERYVVWYWRWTKREIDYEH